MKINFEFECFQDSSKLLQSSFLNNRTFFQNNFFGFIISVDILGSSIRATSERFECFILS